MPLYAINMIDMLKYLENNIILDFADWLWGWPLLIMLLIVGIRLTIATGFIQIRRFGYVVKNTFGKIFVKNKDKNSLSPYQAACSALAASVGASNIVGVPVAIALGGPGAVFWMWLVAVVGMATKYSEIVLGIKYREKNSEGKWSGGPYYYLKKGIPNTINSKYGIMIGKILAVLFSFFLMIEILPAVAVQSVTVVDNVAVFGVSKIVIAIALFLVVSLIVGFGIKGIGSVVDKLVPFMAITYIICGMIIIFINENTLVSALSLIFKNAFTGTAAVGGFAGATLSTSIRWGVARGLYSNEAGMGESVCSHINANVKHPAEQGLWGIVEVFVDTIIVCTMTAIIVLSTNEWTNPSIEASILPARAFERVFGEFVGRVIINSIIACFVISTIIVIVYYCEKQAEALFNKKVAVVVRFISLTMIILGSMVRVNVIFKYDDFILGIAVLANIIGLMIMAPQVKELTKDYFKGTSNK